MWLIKLFKFLVNNFISVVILIVVVNFVSSNYSNNIQDNTDNIFAVFVGLLSILLVKTSLNIDHIHTKTMDALDNNHDEIKYIIDNQKNYIPFANHIRGSSYEFVKMARNATKSLFIVGPNLNFIADNNQEIKNLLFQKLKENPNFEVWMLLSDPDHEEINKVMSEVSFTKDFSDQLKKTISKFSNWINEANEPERPLNLKIRKTSVITFSLLFIDAELDNAHVLVTPIPYNTAGMLRPCFLIKKKQHESAFYAYYGAYVNLFNDRSKTKDID